MTALHWAAKRNQYKVCEILLKNHCDVDAKDIVIILL